MSANGEVGNLLADALVPKYRPVRAAAVSSVAAALADRPAAADVISEAAAAGTATATVVAVAPTATATARRSAGRRDRDRRVCRWTGSLVMPVTLPTSGGRHSGRAPPTSPSNDDCRYSSHG